MKIKKYVVIPLMMALIILFQTPTTSNATVFGGRWHKNIKMYINTTNDLVVGPMLTAKSYWNNALSSTGTNIRIEQVYVASEANLIVNAKDYLGIPAGYAEVYPSFTSSSYTSGEIVMNLNKLSEMSVAYKTTAAAHELGHILGLAHSPSGVSSIMSDTLNGLISPTSYDKQELDRIY